jgi:hypothetical protein
VFPRLMNWVFNAMNCSASVNQRCLADNINGTACMFGANTMPYVSTPLFVLNSKYDTWQAGGIIGAGACADRIANCSAQIQRFWGDYGNRMIAILTSLPPQHGGFLSNCQAHCQTGSGSWTQLTIDGTAMGNAFTGWYNATISATSAATESSESDDAATTPAGHGRTIASSRASNHTVGGHRYYEACEIHLCGIDKC